MKQTDDDGALKKIEKILIRVFIGLGVLVIGGVLLLLRFDRGDTARGTKTETETTEDTDEWEAGLSDSTLWLPDECALYEMIPDFTVTDDQGKEFKISDFFGKPTVIVFWASWCTDCKEQMPNMKKYMEAAQSYGDVQFLFIDRLDGEKETKEAAKEYYAGLGIEQELYFDEGQAAFDALGMHNIPTTYFLNADGVIIDWSPSQIETTGAFEGYLQNLMEQKSTVTAGFITGQLTDEEGGIHSSYNQERSVTMASDVLSESQGLMLQYAVRGEDKELFDGTLAYIASQLAGDGLTAWIYTTDGASAVNALLDDLRIYSSLVLAQKTWGGYEELLAEYEDKLLEFGTEDGKYIDFYDSDSGQKAERLTLCYIDLMTMETLAGENEAFSEAYESALSILESGQISEDFPLYYSWYDYPKGSYEGEELNAAEAMMTLLHLAQAEKLPDNTLKWLREQLAGNGVKARYDLHGNVVSGYNYDSTAVYAIIAMIGETAGDAELTGQAVNKMEKMRIRDTALEYNGAFGMDDGSGISSFDQLMPLQAYQMLEGRNE